MYCARQCVRRHVLCHLSKITGCAKFYLTMYCRLLTRHLLSATKKQHKQYVGNKCFHSGNGNENISKEFLHRSEILVASFVQHKLCKPVLAFINFVGQFWPPKAGSKCVMMLETSIHVPYLRIIH